MFRRVVGVAVVGALALPSLALAGGSGPNLTETRLTNQGSGENHLAVADFNGDSILDLATTSAAFDGGTVGLSTGDGTGRFGARQTFGSGVEPSSIASGDLNGDGRPDVAVTFEGDRDDEGPGAVAVFLNDGAGGFVTLPPVAVGDRPVGIQLAELNGDAHLDAAVIDARADANGVTLLLGDGVGGLIPQPRIAPRPCASEIEVGDVEPDGEVDLLVADDCEKTSVLLEGNGAGVFTPREISTPSSASSIELADLNNDSRPDLLYATGSGISVAVQLAEPSGYAAPTNTRLGIRHTVIEVADLDRDGNLDVVAGAGRLDFNETGQLEVRPGDGSGRLGTTRTFAGRGGGGVSFADGTLAVADLNRDAIPDVVTVDSPFATFLGTDEPLPRCGGRTATLIGRPKDDGLKGTRAKDVIVADAGRDFIDGLKEDDTICGGADQDAVEGDDGDDRVIGGGARDHLAGDDGDDSLIGGGGNDVLDGGKGDDALKGGPGKDRCTGGKGTDSAKSCERTQLVP